MIQSAVLAICGYGALLWIKRRILRRLLLKNRLDNTNCKKIRRR